MQKIAIVTAAWQRHNLFEFFCWYWKELSIQLKPRGIELRVYCAVSEPITQQIASHYKIKTVMIANDPLYLKHNAATQLAQKDNPDFCIFLGSDDLMNMALIMRYADIMKYQPVDYLATLDWHFFDTKSKGGIYWGGYREQYRHGEPCGAGRALSNYLLDLIKWQPWIPGYDKVLDTGFKLQMDKLRPVKKFFRMGSTQGLCGLDIKTSVNMTPFAKWDNTEIINPLIAKQSLIKNFDQETANRILKLQG